MTYARAKLIIWNHEAYTREQVREAAVFILSRLDAKDEDIQQAALVA